MNCSMCGLLINGKEQAGAIRVTSMDEARKWEVCSKPCLNDLAKLQTGGRVPVTIHEQVDVAGRLESVKLQYGEAT